MTSSKNTHAPVPLKFNDLYKFFPEMVYRPGDPDSPPLGPFKVRGSYEIKRKERDIPVQRFLILSPVKGCNLPVYEEYAVYWPQNVLAGDLVTFEQKKSALRIRVQIESSGPGIRIATLPLKNHMCPFSEYVIYEEQVEGTWIPVEVDGDELRP